MTKPLIGISADWQEKGDFSEYPHYALRQHYSDAVTHAGGTSLLLPYQPDAIETYADLIDGLIIPGGLFSFPKEWYINKTTSPYEQSPRTENDIALLKAVIKRDKPILGICAGMQLIAGIMDCKLTGSLHSDYNTDINHWDNSPVTQTSHDIIIHKDGILESLYPSLNTTVNSHHQEAVVKLSDNIRLEAVAEDNVIEAISLKEKRFVVGVQWHPEVLSQKHNSLDNTLFAALIENC